MLVEDGGATRDRTADLLNANQALSQLSYSPNNSIDELATNKLACQFYFNRGGSRGSIIHYATTLSTKSKMKLVGLGGFEPPTSPLSGVRSNQLSYRPSESSNISLLPNNLCGRFQKQVINTVFKGGDPAPGSPRATLLRLHPSHESHRGDRHPEG